MAGLFVSFTIENAKIQLNLKKIFFFALNFLSKKDYIIEAGTRMTVKYYGGKC